MENVKEQPVYPTQDALYLADAEARTREWADKMTSLLPPGASIPKSIFIPIQDLQNIVDGYKDNYDLTGARLYFCFENPDDFYVKGILCPVGSLKASGMNPEDVIVDVYNGAPTADPTAMVSVYDFTMPCPPTGGCAGASPLL